MRSHIIGALCAAVLLLLNFHAGAQALEIPDTLEVREVSDRDALEQMRRCFPRIGQDKLDSMRQRQARNDTSTTTSFSGPNDRFVLIEKRGLWMCVMLSPSRYPIFPVDTLASGARPRGGDPARVKAFFQAISRSLAESGFARALIAYESSGNANALYFAVNADQPDSLAVETRFLKKGEFVLSEWPIRIEDPTVTGLTTTRVGQNSTRLDIFLDKNPKRDVVAGYLIRAGNDRTRRYSFGGTTWKSPTQLSTTSAFEKGGVVVYRAKDVTSFGSWKVDDGVLYFDINKYSYFSAVLDENDYLDVEGRRRAAAPVGVAAAEVGSTEQRFKTRFFQDGNLAAEKEAREKLTSATAALQTLISLRKAEVLAESAVGEKAPEEAVKKRQTLCEGDLFAMAMILAIENNLKAGELCMSYVGSRAEWKETILKEGCKGRCSPL